MQIKLFTILLLSFAAAAISEDFKTVNGKEYKDATVTRVEPDGVVVKTNSGITKVYFTELPKDVQEHFHYDSGKGRLIFCRAGRQLHRISKATGGNPTSTTGRRRKEQRGGSGTTKRHKSYPGFANPLRHASETGR